MDALGKDNQTVISSSATIRAVSTTATPAQQTSALYVTRMSVIPRSDGPELVQWIKERLPIKKSIFLTHGEEEPQMALAEAIRGMVPDDCIIRPRLDDVYDLTGSACALIAEETKPRIDPSSVAKLDWNNDLQSLILDIQEELKGAADAKSKAVLIRKLRRALTADAAKS